MDDTLKGRKFTLREILDEIAADEEFSEEERELAREKLKEIAERGDDDRYGETVH